MSQRTLRLLLAFYPRTWRKRYGEEFTQLLADLEADEPGSALRNALDVIRNAAPVQVAWHPALAPLLVFLVSGTLATIAITTQQAQQAVNAAQQNAGRQVLIIQKRHATYVSRNFTNHGSGASQVLTVRATSLAGHKKVTFICRAADCTRSSAP